MLLVNKVVRELVKKYLLVIRPNFFRLESTRFSPVADKPNHTW